MPPNARVEKGLEKRSCSRRGLRTRTSAVPQCPQPTASVSRIFHEPPGLTLVSNENLVRHGYKAPDPRLFQHRPTACCETASRFVVSAAAVAPPPSPLEVALSHPADAFHRPPTPTGTHPHTTGGYTPANTRQQCQNIGGDGQETAGGCRRSRGAGWRSGSPVDCCRGHGAALATEMSTRRAFGGRPREPAASVRRSEALAADGGWARGGAGPRRGAAARWRPWQQTHLPCPQAGRRGQGRR